MEPIPETVEAINELDPSRDDPGLVGHLRQSAALVEILAPDTVGFSLASHDLGVTFTIIATDDEIAALDGIQYLSGGPCVEALHERRSITTTSDGLFSEPRWRAFAQATSAAGIRSTLTLPVMRGDEVVGTVNLYGRTDDAFDGKHELLAVVFDAWAPGAVTNADLSFSTRRLAEEAPEILRDSAVIDTAVGIVAAAGRLPVDAARHVIEESAARAGVPVADLARVIVELHTSD